MTPIDFTITPEGIAILRLNDRAGRNALSRALVEAFRIRLAELSSEAVKVCVLCGLDDVFCSGADRGLLLDLTEHRTRPAELALSLELMQVDVPVIAAMRGHAVGGGLVLGLGADMVVLGRSSRYGANFMDFGFTPGMGSTALMADAFGPYLANEMLLSGRLVRGSQLEGRALVNAILPNEAVEAEAMRIAEALVEKPRYALTLLKGELSLPRRQRLGVALAAEAMMHEVCFSKPEVRALIETSFMDS